MDQDKLADSLLAIVLDADPIAGSLYGLPGFDALLPDISLAAEESAAARFDEIAAEAAGPAPEDLTETGRQTLDFVRLVFCC